MKETTHRRPNSDFFRVYEIAGMAHRESRYASEIDLKKWSIADLKGAQWSTFPNSFIYHAVFESMLKWISEDKAPAASALIRTVGSTDEIVRDKHGNALDGVRTLHTDVPLARLVAATPKGRPNWYMGMLTRFSYCLIKLTDNLQQVLSGHSLEMSFVRYMDLPSDTDSTLPSLLPSRLSQASCWKQMRKFFAGRQLNMLDFDSSGQYFARLY
jgi:hypothetical protein